MRTISISGAARRGVLFTTGLRGVGVGVAGFGVGFLPGSIFTSCASARSCRIVSAPNPKPIHSNAQAVKTIAFITFAAPPMDYVGSEKLKASLGRPNEAETPIAGVGDARIVSALRRPASHGVAEPTTTPENSVRA